MPSWDVRNTYPGWPCTKRVSTGKYWEIGRVESITTKSGQRLERAEPMGGPLHRDARILCQHRDGGARFCAADGAAASA